jgi:hypothetical protein
MSIICGNKYLSEASAQRCAKLKELIRRWQEGLSDVGVSLLANARRRRADAARRRRASERVAGGQLTPVPDDTPEQIAAAALAGNGETEAPELVPSSDQRSHALAAVCERLLQELDREEVKAAEIRFVVHKREDPSYPRPDPQPADSVSDGELVWELRRQIGRSGDTIADVARALETRGIELDENARDLLRDELAALDADLETLNAYLSDPVDWDREFGSLIAGEVAPFDDFSGDEDEENDGRG